MRGSKAKRLERLSVGVIKNGKFILIPFFNKLYARMVLVISNLILAKNKNIQCGNEYLVFSNVSKWRVVVGAKWMVLVPTACPVRV